MKKYFLLIVSVVALFAAGCKTKNDAPVPDKKEFALSVWTWNSTSNFIYQKTPFPAIDENDNSYFFLKPANEQAPVLFSLDTTGNLRWKVNNVFQLSSNRSYSVIYSNNNLYFYNNRTLYCYNSNNGSMQWSYQLNDEDTYIQNLLVKNNEVWFTYGQSGKIILVKLDASGNRLWDKTFNLYSFGQGIAANGTKLFLLLKDVFEYRNDLIAVNMNDGSPLWKFVPDTNIAGNGLSVDGNGNIYFSSFEGALFSVDGNNGTLRWNYYPENDRDNGYSSQRGVTILPDNDVVFADGDLICFDESGNEKWRSTVDSRLSFTLGDNNILYGWGDIVDVKLFAINASSGEKLSIKFSTLDEDMQATAFPPVITHNGNIIMAGISKIHCITSMSTGLEKSGWPKQGKGYGNNPVNE